MILRDEERTLGGRRHRLTLALADESPPRASVSAAHCLGFDSAERFLLTRHVDRCWTIPGGHREAGESAEEAMRREAMEEAAATVVDAVVVATERVELLEGEPDPRYPQPAFQVFFVARVAELGVLVPNAECLESRLFSTTEARGLPGWMEQNQQLFEAALSSARARWFPRPG